MPADPQHPDIAALVERLRRRASRIRAIGFVNDESASDADLAADNLEALARPQHPDITALVSCGVHALCTLGAICDYPRCQCKEAPTAARKVVEAALRTLARPVEDEEVREMVEFYRDSASMRRTNGGHPPFIERDENTASLLASLAREKASAEQEIARLRKFLRTALAVVDESGNATADQIGILQEAERALAAAAGAEEPR